MSLDFCEGNFQVHDRIAEFWTSLSCLFLATLGFSGVYLSRRGRQETRYQVLYMSLALTGLTSFAVHATLSDRWARFDQFLFTAVILLFVYLLDGDDYLLIFWQLHVLISSYPTYKYRQFYLCHISIVGLIAIFILHNRVAKVRIPAAQRKTVDNLFHLTLAGTLAGLSLIVYETVTCNQLDYSIHILPFRAIGNVLMAIALYSAPVVGAFLRCWNERNPVEVLWWYHICPYISTDTDRKVYDRVTTVPEVPGLSAMGRRFQADKKKKELEESQNVEDRSGGGRVSNNNNVTRSSGHKTD